MGAVGAGASAALWSALVNRGGRLLLDLEPGAGSGYPNKASNVTSGSGIGDLDLSPLGSGRRGRLREQLNDRLPWRKSHLRSRGCPRLGFDFPGDRRLSLGSLLG